MAPAAEGVPSGFDSRARVVVDTGPLLSAHSADPVAIVRAVALAAVGPSVAVAIAVGLWFGILCVQLLLFKKVIHLKNVR